MPPSTVGGTHTDLPVPVYHGEKIKVVVVVAEWVEKGLGDLEPAEVENQLEEGEEGDVEVDGVGGVALGGVDELGADHGDHEEGIHSQRHHLQILSRC